MRFLGQSLDHMNNAGTRIVAPAMVAEWYGPLGLPVPQTIWIPLFCDNCFTNGMFRPSPIVEFSTTQLPPAAWGENMGMDFKIWGGHFDCLAHSTASIPLLTNLICHSLAINHRYIEWLFNIFNNRQFQFVGRVEEWMKSVKYFSRYRRCILQISISYMRTVIRIYPCSYQNYRNRWMSINCHPISRKRV